MKKLYVIIIALFGISLILPGSVLCQDKSKSDKGNIDEFANKLNETGQKYTTTVDNFNGTVIVKVGDKMETLTLTPGESLKVPKDAPTEKGMVTWKSVTEYEDRIMVGRDPRDQRVRWFIENIQTDRVNRVLKELTDRLKSDWEKNNPGRKGSDKLSFYMPGNNDSEKLAAVGDVIDQIISDFGMKTEAFFTEVEWKAKLVTGDERLYKPDLRELVQKEGLIKYYITIQSLLSQSSGSTLQQ